MIKNIKENWLGYFGASLVLIGYFFNAHGNILCWPTWIIGNLCVGIYSVQKRAYPTAGMSFVLVLISLYGWTRWL